MGKASTVLLTLKSGNTYSRSAVEIIESLSSAVVSISKSQLEEKQNSNFVEKCSSPDSID